MDYSPQERDKNSFRFFINTAEAQVGKTRSLTREEVRYLRKSNLLRLLYWLDYVFPLFLLVLLSFGILLLISLALVGYIDNPSIFTSIVLHVLLPLLLTLGVLALIWKRFPRKTKLWLSLKNLKAVELTGHLGIQLDPVEHPEKVYKLNNTCFMMPKHWHPYVYKQFKDKNELPKVQLWAVKRADTSNTSFSYTYRVRSSSFLQLSRFQDYQYHALTFGALQIKEDVKAQIPYVRENHFWLTAGLLGMIISVFSAIYFSITLEKHNSAVAKLKNEITVGERQLNLGVPIDPQLFAERDLFFSADSAYGNLVLRASKKFEYIDVSLGRNDRPFLLTKDEYKMILRVTSVSPNVSLGYTKAKAKTLLEYREAIKQVIAQSTDLPIKIRNKASSILNAMDDELLEQQIRSYGNGFRIDPTFASQFFPIPFIYLPNNPFYQFRKCGDRTLFCLNLQAEKLLEAKDMALIHGAGHTAQEEADFELISTLKLQKIHKIKKVSSTKKSISTFDYWTQDLGAISLILFLGSIAALISFFQARRHLKKYYQKKYQF